MFSARLSYSCCESGDKAAMKLMAGIARRSNALQERPETVAVGANVLAGTTPEKIVESTRAMVERANEWANPFGDGTAGERIVTILREQRRE
jgi:UDP-N-acetylglucosamine 2-epimerase